MIWPLTVKDTPHTTAGERVAPRARWWTAPALAWSFLTVLPVPRTTGGPALGWAIALFPLVGLLLGALLGAIGLALDLLLPPGPTAAVLLVLGAILTGGLHLDGLMDTVDGVFGGRTRERRLEIMRDSRVGAFGVIALALVLLVQYSTLAELSGGVRAVALVVALALARWAMVIAVTLFRSARADGLGATWHAASGAGPLVLATVVAATVAGASGTLGLLALPMAGGAALLVGRFLVGRLGGLTGDTYGALAVLVEMLILCTAVPLVVA